MYFGGYRVSVGEVVVVNSIMENIFIPKRLKIFLAFYLFIFLCGGGKDGVLK